MKKLILFISLLFCPALLFAQAAGSGSGALVGSLLYVIFIILIGLGVFLAIRAIMLWYWKITDILQNQERQIYEQQQTNQLLRQQIDLLSKRTPPSA